MKTLKKVPYTPVFVEEMSDGIVEGEVYISKKYQTSRHLCLCGCESLVIMPLDNGKKWWRLVEEENDTVSFIGSVGNYSFECKSHYIMTKNVANFI